MVKEYERLILKEDIRRYKKSIKTVNANLILKANKIKYYDDPINGIFTIKPLLNLEEKIKALYDLKNYMELWDKVNGF